MRFITYIVYAFSTLLLRKQNEKNIRPDLATFPYHHKSGFGLQDGMLP